MEELRSGVLEGRRWQIPRPSLSGSSGGSSAASATYASVPPHQPSSNHSSHSASSGSLLLSAANLAKVQNHRTSSAFEYPSGREGDPPANAYRSNLASYVESSRTDPVKPHRKLQRTDGRADSVAATIHEESPAAHSDPFWQNAALDPDKRPRQEDTESTASSTHFTVVNGFTRHRAQKHEQMWCCKSSHQITVLVISMTILFMAGILAAICYVEMRQRRDSNYRFS